MDISDTLAPKSDQQNFDDYVAGPKVVTVADVKSGNSEQPVEIHLVEFPGRPFKPSKSMRRVIAAAWGTDSTKYVGQQLQLYGDPTVKFGGEQVGGIRISHMTGIGGGLDVKIAVSKGKRATFHVEPLQVTPPRDWASEIQQATTLDQLRELYKQAPENVRPSITSAVDALKAQQASEPAEA